MSLILHLKEVMFNMDFVNHAKIYYAEKFWTAN